MNKLTDQKIREAIKNMNNEERESLASKMLSPLRCGGSGYENGKYYLILGGKKSFAKEINNVIRKMNPNWSDEALKPYFVNENK